MSDFLRNGWHPKGKDGGKESWRGDFKGINQVAGWVGKGKGSGESAASTHIARPLDSLKDPASFGAPPRNVNYHGGAALPNEITPHRGGIGAPLTQEQIESARRATTSPSVQQEAEQSQKSGPPPLPYRADRTGLRTDNLPPPPKHQALGESSPVTTPTTTKPAPHLPPRLPARQNTATPPPPPTYETATSNANSQSSAPLLNQSAITRLGNAGVSVPGLGIGKSNNDTTSHTSSGLSELQNRFTKMNMSNNKVSTPTTASPQPISETQPQSQTPTWQQTRQALTTANSAYKDPSSVSLSDAQNAAQTAQNAQRSAAAFRERNQETINAAQTRATQINKKYNMTGRLNKWLEDANAAHDKQEKEAARQAAENQTTPGQQPDQQAAQSTPLQQPQPQMNSWQAQKSQGQQPVSSPPPQSSTPELTASISRKPPPPPPPKKPASMQAPPPVPLGTKPSFG